jgi:hypothetical protein
MPGLPWATKVTFQNPTIESSELRSGTEANEAGINRA